MLRGAVLALLVPVHVAIGGGQDVRFGHVGLEHRDPEARRQRDFARPAQPLNYKLLILNNYNFGMLFS